MPRILVVESEQAIADAVERCLRGHGYAVTIVNAGPAALRAIDRFEPDLIVLEVISLADESVNFCRRVRARAKIATPLLILTPRNEDMESADFPADDRVSGPLRTRELTARIRALLFRSGCQARSSAKSIASHDLRIDARTRTVETPRGHVRLTAREFDLLYFLTTHPGQVFNRQQLLSHVWDIGFKGDTRTVTSHIRRLRSKVELDSSRPRHVKTGWGVGYTCEP